MLIDSHAHLGHKQFDSDLAAVIARAEAAGVTQYVTPAVDLPNARQLLALARLYPQIHPAVGIHPCDVDSVTGEAWVDEQTGRVARIRANVAAQLDEIGIKSMEADVRYGPAENFADESEWVPLDAVVDLRTPHQHWRNTHTFTSFRKFEVSTVEQKKSAPK